MNKSLLNISFVLAVSLGLMACSKSNERLFDLSCSSETQCTRTAKAYLVQADGLFVKLRSDFVEECLEKKQKNIVTGEYCKKMISPGESKTFTTSARVIKHFKETGFNPLDADVNRRMELAEKKVYGQII